MKGASITVYIQGHHNQLKSKEDWFPAPMRLLQRLWSNQYPKQSGSKLYFGPAYSGCCNDCNCGDVLYGTLLIKIKCSIELVAELTSGMAYDMSPAADDIIGKDCNW